MRNLLSVAAFASFVYLTGCGNSEPRRVPMPPQAPVQPMPPQAPVPPQQPDQPDNFPGGNDTPQT